MRCRTAFTFTNRKHHCRNCGNVFDQQCSSKTLPLPHLGIMQAVRVDDGCYARLTSKDKGTPVPKGFDAAKPARTLYQGMQPREARVSREDDAFDADLKRALEMSLEESKAPVGQGYVPSSQLQHQKSATTNGTSGTNKPLPKPSEEEEDPDLAAAIAASLAEMEDQKRKHATAFKQQTSNTATAPITVVARPDYELTEKEAENINLFATLVERLGHQPPGTILREPRIQELYEGVGLLRGKLARTFGECCSKHGKFISFASWIIYGRDPDSHNIDTLLDLHSKLASVVRYYDRMLEDRLNKTYSTHHHSMAGYPLPSSQPQPLSNPYPSLAATAPDFNPNAGGAESFYTGRPSAPPAVAPSDPYQQAPQQTPYAGYGGALAQPTQAPSNPYAQQPPPPQALAPQYSGGQPQPQPQLQRVPSATTYASSQPSGSPIQRRVSHSQQPGFPSQPPGQYTPGPSQPSQPQAQTQDPAASYYFQLQQQGSAPPLNAPSQPQPKPQQQDGGPPSPLQYSHPPSTVPPQPQPMQPMQPQYSGAGQGQPTPYPTNQAFAQHPAQGWGVGGGYPGMAGVPQQHNVPVQPKVEESLIEL